MTARGPNGSPRNWKTPGTRDSDRTLALLSGDYLGSKYAKQEWTAVLAGDPLNERGRLIRLGLLAPRALAQDLHRLRPRSTPAAAAVRPPRPNAGRAK